MTLEEALNEFDGVGYRLAVALNVSKQCVSVWKKNRKIPYSQQIKLEHYTQGRLKADNYFETEGRIQQQKLKEMAKRKINKIKQEYDL
jgi:hypothetical protein